MTKRWKLKINSSNILLVLITLILVKAEWVKGESEDLQKDTNSVESDRNRNENGQTHIYIGNDEIAEYFFHSSIDNNSFVLNEINKCLNNFQLITCIKMLLLSRINDVVSLMEETNASQEDMSLLNGLLVFKMKNETVNSGTGRNDYLSLDKEISAKLRRIFQKRSLLVNLFPKIQIEIEPAPEKNAGDFVCFNYTIQQKLEPKRGGENEKNEGRKRKGGGMSMMMMVPQLIMLGLMPFTLASLKAMVMNAVMINMMALNGAIFMTIRNLVFGPRQGDNVKYVNYGYSKDRQTQSPKPVLIIHSPAAFVKQPAVHKKRVQEHSLVHHFPQNYFPDSHYSGNGHSHLYHHQKAESIEDYDSIINNNENQQNRRTQTGPKRNDSKHFNGFYKSNANGQAKKIRNENKSTNYLTTSYEKIYKPEVKMQEKNQNYQFGSNPYYQFPQAQSYEKFNSHFDYSNENERKNSHLTFNINTFRQSSG